MFKTMNMDVVNLREFYSGKLGIAAERSIAMSLSAMWDTSKSRNERILGMGYAAPFLDRFASDSKECMAFMPAAQGAVQWPVSKLSATALVYDEELPLADSSIDKILMVHLLEHSESPEDTLREAWRVLAPNGKILLVLPNRRGLWARFEHTPFGTGRPFSRGQIRNLLRNAMFSPDAWSDALHFPPMKRDSFLSMQPGIERLGRRIWPVFSGVIIVEATKKMYQGLPVTARATRRAFVPVLVPQGNTRNTRGSSNFNAKPLEQNQK